MNEQLTYLFDRYFKKIATSEELLELNQFIDERANYEQLLHLIGHSWNEFDGEGQDGVSEQKREEILNLILKDKNKRHFIKPVHRVHLLKTAWFRYAAAVVIVLGISGYLWYANSNRPSLLTATNSPKTDTDIAPGDNKAILTLADGTTIKLDNTANGTLAQQGNAQVIKLSNGQLAYQLKGVSGKEVLMNTVSTPKGGQYKIQLPDGTNVWLNAASSITYPTAFTGNKREVIIDGEAYLEVKSNKGQPFFVTTKTSAIQVLGTSFNINAYEDEPSKTSLIEGSIKVALRPSGNAPGSSGFILKPGQAYKNGKVITTDIDQDIAWKNGLFNFEGLGVKEVMNQLQRWYDIEVIYEGEIPDVSFYGKIHKNVKLSIVLDALRDIGVQFRMEGERKLMVSP